MALQWSWESPAVVLGRKGVDRFWGGPEAQWILGMSIDVLQLKAHTNLPPRPFWLVLLESVPFSFRGTRLAFQIGITAKTAFADRNRVALVVGTTRSSAYFLHAFAARRAHNK